MSVILKNLNSLSKCLNFLVISASWVWYGFHHVILKMLKFLIKQNMQKYPFQCLNGSLNR